MWTLAPADSTTPAGSYRLKRLAAGKLNRFQANGPELVASNGSHPEPRTYMDSFVTTSMPRTNMEANEWFEVVRNSRLVDAATLSTWQNRCTRYSDVRTIAAMMVSDGMLTAWQSEKLLDRRWKGFFVDQYCIRNNLGSDHPRGVLVLEAMNMQDREILVLEVIPPARERRKDGRLIYSVRPKECRISGKSGQC